MNLWLDDPVTAVAALPAFALPIFVLVSAFLEYVFPPYWGDVFMLLGFFLAGQGAAAPWLIFVVAVLGSVLGSICAFLLGRKYGLRVARKVTFRRTQRAREKSRELLERYGEQFLVVNRFVPIVRGLLLFGAGALELRLVASVAWSAVSNLVWVGVLMAVGLMTAGSFEEIVADFRRTQEILAIAVTFAAVGAGLLFYFRRERQTEDA